MSKYKDDKGNWVDATKIQEELTDKAIERTYDKDQNIDEDMYMQALYPKEHDEYLVDGAILECSMATLMPQILRGRLYQVNMPSKWTVLKVSENQKAKCCGDLRHATVADCEKNVNIEPFQCNCKNAPHTEEEWKKLFSDSSCLKEGTCKALMNLNKMWDNLPVEVPYLKYKDDKYGMVSGINMTSMLFCRHGGIITPVTSGQRESLYMLFALACTTGGEYVDILSNEQQELNAIYIYNFFKSQGWTTESICGMLGNLQEECVMNPGAWEYWMKAEKGYGLVQWTPAQDYFDYANLSPEEANRMAINDPKSLMDSQLDFLMETFQSKEYCRWYTDNVQNYYDKLPLSSDDIIGVLSYEEYSQSKYNPGDLALIFHASYERSGDDTKALQERVDAAMEWYNFFMNNQ